MRTAQPWHRFLVAAEQTRHALMSAKTGAGGNSAPLALWEIVVLNSFIILHDRMACMTDFHPLYAAIFWVNTSIEIIDTILTG